MRFSWTQAAAGALFLGLLAGMFVLPGRLLAPEHRVQVSLGLAQESAGGAVQAASPVAPHETKTRVRAPRRPDTPRTAPPAGTPSNRLAAGVVRNHPPPAPPAQTPRVAPAA